jgi:hypothetical protein
MPGIFVKAYAEMSSVRRLRETMALPPRSILKHSLGRHFLQFPSIVGYSQHLVPIPKDMPPWYFNTGPMLPPAQETTEEIPERLASFLKENPQGQPIIYIGFGSFSLTQFLPLARHGGGAGDAGRDRGARPARSPPGAHL